MSKTQKNNKKLYKQTGGTEPSVYKPLVLQGDKWAIQISEFFSKFIIRLVAPHAAAVDLIEKISMAAINKFGN